MNIKSGIDSFNKMLANGTVIYRDVGFRRSPYKIPPFAQPIVACAPEKVEMPLGDHGNFMLRISMSGQFGWNPIAYVPESYNRGIVLFVNEKIPDNWTHLIVTGNSFRRQQRDDQVFYTGAVFATIPKPYNMDAYLEFRTQMGNIFSEVQTDGNRRRLPFQEKFKLVRDIRPPENRPEEIHLFSESFGENGTWFYETLVWDNKDAKQPEIAKQKVAVPVG